MLKKINEGGVESDTGFSIQITGSDIMEYRENDRVVRINLGYNPQNSTVNIYVSKISRWNSLETQLISNIEKTIIADNIKSAVKLLTGNFQIL
ncbi:MAG TPA: hypothetical protein VGV92_09340 [Gammaproteobacteria bacterium]|nr:hypothetical protein [Gammaproteobacteria bacterium]